MKTYLNDKIEAGLEDTAFFFILFGRPKTSIHFLILINRFWQMYVSNNLNFYPLEIKCANLELFQVA